MSELWVVSCDFVEYWGAYAPKKILDPETDIMDQFVDPETDTICQFLDPETDK